MKKLLCLLFAAFLLCVSASALELPSGLNDVVPRELIDNADKLRGCDAYFSVIISEEDAKLYKRLGINVSCEAKYEVKSLYHK